MSNPSSTTFDQNSGRQLSWIVFILPYIEQAAAAEQFDLAVSVFAQAGNPQENFLPFLTCPSDANNREVFQHPTHTQNRRFAKGNYAAFVGPVHVELQYIYPGGLIGPKELTSPAGAARAAAHPACAGAAPGPTCWTAPPPRCSAPRFAFAATRWTAAVRGPSVGPGRR